MVTGCSDGELTIITDPQIISNPWLIDDAYYNLKMSLKKIEMRYYPPGINLSFKEEG